MNFKDFYHLDEVKGMNGKKYANSLYIATHFDNKEVKDYYKAIDLSKADEVESTPHMTFYYSPKVENIDKEKLYEIMYVELKGCNFPLEVEKYHVFEGVNQGTQDCLVVKLKVSDEIKKLQRRIQKLIEKNNGDAEQTYGGDWQPHMTIAYFKKGEVPEFPKNTKGKKLKAKDLFFQFGGDDQEKKKLY